MNAKLLPIALLGFLAIGAIVPPWMYFVEEHTATLPEYVGFLVQLTLPALVLLFVAGWLQPRGRGA